jgi:hypothetical protein
LNEIGHLPKSFGEHEFRVWLFSRLRGNFVKFGGILVVVGGLFPLSGYDDVLRPLLQKHLVANIYLFLYIQLIAISWDVLFLWPEKRRVRRRNATILKQSEDIRPKRLRSQYADPNQLALDLKGDGEHV